MSNGTPPRAAALTGRYVAIMMLLCLLWGFNFIAIKVGNHGFPPLLAAGLRSAGATVLVTAYALARRQGLGGPRRLLLHGVATGVLFALEFLFIYGGASYTSASRVSLLVYTSPFWAAAGAHLLLHGDRLSFAKVSGLALSFLGVVAVFGAPGGDAGPHHVFGDILGLLGAASWAVTTIYVKRFVQPFGIGSLQVLFYQLAFSTPILLAAAFVAGQAGPVEWRLDSTLALIYQTVVVATITYVAWFWLLGRTHASSLHSFTFFTPVFAVIFSGLFLGESLPLLLWVGLALVAAGTYLVNRPAAGFGSGGSLHRRDRRTTSP